MELGLLAVVFASAVATHPCRMRINADLPPNLPDYATETEKNTRK